MLHSCDRPCKTACFWGFKETPKDAEECHQRLCKFVGYFQVFPSKLLATPQGACSAQKRPAKHAPKIAFHLLNPRGRTWTARDQFSAPFAVIKQYHVSGNTVVNSSYLKIRNNDDMDFCSENEFLSSVENLSRVGDV